MRSLFIVDIHFKTIMLVKTGSFLLYQRYHSFQFKVKLQEYTVG